MLLYFFFFKKVIKEFSNSKKFKMLFIKVNENWFNRIYLWVFYGIYIKCIEMEIRFKFILLFLVLMILNKVLYIY